MSAETALRARLRQIKEVRPADRVVPATRDDILNLEQTIIHAATLIAETTMKARY
jgi:hypothetical protein